MKELYNFLAKSSSKNTEKKIKPTALNIYVDDDYNEFILKLGRNILCTILFNKISPLLPTAKVPLAIFDFLRGKAWLESEKATIRRYQEKNNYGVVKPIT